MQEGNFLEALLGRGSRREERKATKNRSRIGGHVERRRKKRVEIKESGRVSTLGQEKALVCERKGEKTVPGSGSIILYRLGIPAL